MLYRDLSGYPRVISLPLQQQLRVYTESIVQQSWPAQRRGLANDQERVELAIFQRGLLRTEATTMSQHVLHSEVIATFNRLVELRSQPIESISTSVPGVLWTAVLIGAVLTIVFFYYFVVVSLRLHALLTLMVGVMIFLIAALDHPYLGEVSVTADAYQVVLNKVMIPTP